MRILISNDDGIHARGIAVLTVAARLFAGDDADIIVIAPAEERSGYSHRITLGDLHVGVPDDPRAAMALNDDEPGPDKVYTVAGTPADCVRIALARGGPLDRARAGFHARLGIPKTPDEQRPDKDWLPDLVLSGVNHGANFGHDLHYSGTVAVAAEAAGFGVPAVGFSRLRETRDMVREDVGGLAELIATLLRRWADDGTLPPGRVAPGSGGALLNVNFPCLPASEFRGLQVTRCAGYHYEEHFQRHGRGDGIEGDYIAIREGNVAAADLPPGLDSLEVGSVPTDEDAIRAGCISVTPLTIDWTRYAHLVSLRERASDWWPATGRE